MARDGGNRGDRVSSTRIGDDIYNWGHREYVRFYESRLPMSIAECREEVNAARDEFEEKGSITVRGFNAAGFAEPYSVSIWRALPVTWNFGNLNLKGVHVLACEGRPQVASI